MMMMGNQGDVETTFLQTTIRMFIKAGVLLEPRIVTEPIVVLSMNGVGRITGAEVRYWGTF